MKTLPHGYPHRIVSIPGWATLFKCPRHIVRIDKNVPGFAGTHGWQVRYTKPSVFFSDDSVEAGRKSPLHSLADASEYLAAVYNGPKTVRTRSKCLSSKKNLIQEVGLRLISRMHKGRNVMEHYIEVTSLQNDHTPDRVYVGTDNTLTEARLQAALEKARQLRKRMLELHAAHKKW